MLARNEIIIKWTLYSLVSCFWVILQTALFYRLEIWGVMPFLYPLLAAIPATYEGPSPGTAFALGAGVVCDLLLPAPMPCFYTLVFPFVGLCAALLSMGALPAGFFCSFVSAIPAVFLPALFHCFLFWADGTPYWREGMYTAVRELAVTLPLVIPMTASYRWVYRKMHEND